MKWINRLYIFFLGIILTITTGFGIAAFYPEPVRPEYPSRLNSMISRSCNETPTSTQSAECKKQFEEQEKAQQEYDRKVQEYSNTNAGYTRTAIFFGVALGAVFAMVGIGMIKKSKLVANGLLLAGVLSAIFTRLLISLASLGANVSGTEGANMVGVMEFGILLILSLAVIFVGLTTLKEEHP